MTKSYKTGVIITGDATGAVKAVNLTDAELKKLNETQKRAKDAAKNTSTEWGKMAKQAAMVGVAAAGAAAAGIAAMVKGSVNAADAAIKAAQGAGVTVETLTAMQYAAELSGVSNDKLATSMGRLNRSISDAAKGLKTQSQAFADLGITVSDAEGNLKSADKVMLEVADKFAKYEDGAAKAAIAQELFGRAGADLIPMLNQGAAGINALTLEAEQLGLVIDTETAKAAEKFNDTLTTLGKVGAGVGNRLMADMLPAMNDITGLMLDYAKNSDAAGTASKVLGGVLKGLATVGIAIGAVFETAGKRLGALAAALVAAATGDFKGAWNIMKESVADTADITRKAIERISKLWSGEFAEAGERGTAVVSGLAEGKATLTRTTKEAEAAEKAHEKALASAAKAVEKMFEAEEKRSAAAAKVLDTTRGNIDLLQRELAAVQAGEKAVEQFNRDKTIELALRSQNVDLLPHERAEYEKLITQQVDLALAVDNAKDAQQAAADAAKAAAEESARVWEEATNRIDEVVSDGWTRTLEGLFERTKVKFSDLADTLKSGFYRLLGELSHMAITRPILVSLGMGGANNALANHGADGGLSSLTSLTGLTKFLQSNPLESIGKFVTQYAGGNAFGADIGMRLENMSAMDMGLSALAGYAGSFLGNKVGQSLFGKEAESAWGRTAGATIGAIWGPIGAALGGAIGGLVDVAFGGDGKTRSALGVSTNAGWSESNTRTAASGLALTAYQKRAGEQADQLALQLQEVLLNTDAVLTSFFTDLGVTVDLAGQTLAGKASQAGNAADGFFGAAGFNGLDSADLQGAPDEFVHAWVARVNEIAKTSIDLKPLEALQREGELLADVLLRVHSQIGPVNATLEALGWAAYDVSVAGMAAADGLVQAFGGLENFTAGLDRYYQLFYSEEERLAATATQLADVFGTLNVQAPTTVDGFRALVDQYAAMGEAGQGTLAALVQIAPAFHQVATAADAAAQAAADLAAAQDEQARTAAAAALAARNATLADIAGTILDNYAAREAELATLEQRLATVNDKIAEMTSGVEEGTSAIPRVVDDITASVGRLTVSSSQLRSMADNLLNTAASLRLGNLSPLSNRQRLDDAERQYRAAQDAARQGDAGGLTAAAQAYLTQAAAYYAVPSDTYTGIFENVVGFMEDMGASLSEQANQAARQEAIMEAQTRALAAAQAATTEELKRTAEVDKLIQDKILIEQQIASLTAVDSLGVMTNQLARLVDITDGINNMAQLLGALPMGIADGIATAIGLAITQYRALTPTEEFFSSGQGFAPGGVATGPASGYPVTLHGTEAIMPLGRGAIPLTVNFSEVVGELRALREENRELRDEVAALRAERRVDGSRQTTALERQASATDRLASNINRPGVATVQGSGAR